MKKAAIRRRIAISRIQRLKIEFTAANDHNPLVPERCAACHGTGKACDATADSAALEECPDCEGTGITGEPTPMFDNHAPALEAPVRADGWLACPGCGIRFSLGDHHRWTGLRHATCGQKILPVPPPDAAAR